MSSTFIPDASAAAVEEDENNSYSLGVAGLKVNPAQTSTPEDGKIQLGQYSIELETTDMIVRENDVEVFRIGNTGDITAAGTISGASSGTVTIDGGTYGT